MPPSVSVIIPIYELDDLRYRNFEFVVNRFLDTPAIHEIIVVEQVKTRSDIALFDPKVRHLEIQTDLDVVHKTLLCNLGALEATGDYLFFNDADIYISPMHVLDGITGKEDVIKPFSYFIKLTDEDTKIFLNKRSLNVKRPSCIFDLGAGAIVVKREAYISIRGYEEQFMGWGFEDQEFAFRLSNIFPVKTIPLTGVHLWHQKGSKIKYIRNNNNLFLDSKRRISQNVEKYIRKMRSQIPADEQLISNLPIHETITNRLLENLKKDAKRSELENKSSIVRLIDKNPSGNIKFGGVKSICHIIAPALLTFKEDLLRRELLALESITIAKENSDLPVDVILLTESDFSNDIIEKFKVVKPERSSRELGDKRGMVFLRECLEIGNDNGKSLILYSNSDCCVDPFIYNKLQYMKCNAIDYHRRDVKDNPQILEEVFSNPYILKETGVDAIALKKEFYNSIKNEFKFDFFLGEPHWDTSVCGFFRKLEQSTINTSDLYHPIHDMAWSTSNLTICGKHNTELYNDYLSCGVLKSHILSLPYPDTSLVIVHYGDDPVRVNAVREALRMIERQDLYYEMVFVELVENDTSFPELDRHPLARHIVLQQEEYNKGLWQKECMMTIGAKLAKGKIIIFLDSDIYSERLDWLSRIREKIINDHTRMVQGFQYCYDSVHKKEHSFVSTAATIVFGTQCDLMVNPGLCWGISKDLLKKNDYLNPYMIYGGGDSIFIHEYLGGDPNNRLGECWLETFHRIQHIKRNNLATAIIDCVDDTIIHVNHGKAGSRNYATRHEMTNFFTSEIPQFVKVQKGLLQWKNINCPEKKMCAQRYNMKDSEHVVQICSEILQDYE